MKNIKIICFPLIILVYIFIRYSTKCISLKINVVLYANEEWERRNIFINK